MFLFIYSYFIFLLELHETRYERYMKRNNGTRNEIKRIFNRSCLGFTFTYTKHESKRHESIQNDQLAMFNFSVYRFITTNTLLNTNQIFLLTYI